MELWQKHLKHASDIRDGYVACGNPKSDRPDPPGGLVEVQVRKFNGKIFFPFIEERGHNSVDFGNCQCRTK